MSNGRRRAANNVYRNQFLRSPAWFARRARWFAGAAQPLTCPGCDGAGDADSMDLHHLDYRGVQRTSIGWRAAEPDEDLVAMCRDRHNELHQILNRDRVLRRHRSRRIASRVAIARLRRRHQVEETG